MDSPFLPFLINQLRFALLSCTVYLVVEISSDVRSIDNPACYCPFANKAGGYQYLLGYGLIIDLVVRKMCSNVSWSSINRRDLDESVSVPVSEQTRVLVKLVACTCGAIIPGPLVLSGSGVLGLNSLILCRFIIYHEERKNESPM